MKGTFIRWINMLQLPCLDCRLVGFPIFRLWASESS